ncbi:MAG: hypothetical protein LAN59_08220 [Acidobacteriia bacterium]|nr:hypothetical protein [Terriglobia bacterium]
MGTTTTLANKVEGLLGASPGAYPEEMVRVPSILRVYARKNGGDFLVRVAASAVFRRLLFASTGIRGLRRRDVTHMIERKHHGRGHCAIGINEGHFEKFAGRSDVQALRNDDCLQTGVKVADGNDLNFPVIFVVDGLTSFKVLSAAVRVDI